MTKIRRMLLLSLAMIMVITLCACNGVGKNAEPTPIPTPEQEATNMDSLPDLGTFVSIVPDNGKYDVPEENEIVKKHIIQKIAESKQVKLDMNVIALPATDYITEINNLLVSGQAVDSITGDYTLFKTLTGQQNFCTPMDQLLQEHAPTVLSTIDESRWSEVMVNNQIMGLPGCSMPEETVMFTRGDVLRMMGLPETKTKEQFIASLAAYKAIGKLPLAMTWSQILDCLAYMYAIPTNDYFLEGEKAVMREHTYYYLNDFIPDMKRFYKLGYLHPDVFTVTEQQMKDVFLAGEAGVYATEYEDIIYDMDALKAKDPNAEMDLVTAPSYRRMPKPRLSGESPIGNVMVLYSKGQHHQALMTYKDWAYTDGVNYVTAQHGVTGTHINYNMHAAEFEYLGKYAEGSPTYTGLYTLGVGLNGIFPQALLKSGDPALQRKSDILRGTYTYLTSSRVTYEPQVPLSDNAKSMLGVYRASMDDAVQRYIKGELTRQKFDEKFAALDAQAKVVTDEATPLLLALKQQAPQE